MVPFGTWPAVINRLSVYELSINILADQSREPPSIIQPKYLAFSLDSINIWIRNRKINGHCVRRTLEKDANWHYKSGMFQAETFPSSTFTLLNVSQITNRLFDHLLAVVHLAVPLRLLSVVTYGAGNSSTYEVTPEPLLVEA